MDIVFLEALRLSASVGLYPREKAAPQPILMDIQMGVSIAPAAVSDDIKDTADYAAVASCLQKQIAVRHFNLLESLAEFAAALILKEFPVSWVRICLTKPGAIKDIGKVGVVIERFASG